VKVQRAMKKAAAVLGCMALLLSAALAAAPSYARYETNDNWSAVYTPQKAEVTADYLVAGGQTVLLGDWPMDSAAPRKETITLQTQTGMAEGVLRCSVEQPEYLAAALDAETCQITAPGYPALLTLTPTEIALALAQPQTVTIHVGWSAAGAAAESLWAEYRVTLLPAGTQSAATPTGAAEQMTITAPDSFAWTEALTLAAAMPAAADTLVLQMNGSSFPEGTRCTFRDETVMLGDAMELHLPVSANETIDLVLDLSESVQEEAITLHALALREGAITGHGEICVLADREALTVQTSAAESSVICGSGLLQYSISRDTTGLSWKLTRLIRTADGVAYTEDENQFFLTVDVQEKNVDEQTKTVLSISNEAGMAPAGSYLLTLERLQNGHVLSEKEIPFFIHYGAARTN